MTSRCDAPLKRWPSSWHVIGIGLLLILSAVASSAVSAQDGADLPPPPQIKRNFNDAAGTQNGVNSTGDPEFQSPLRGRRFRQMMENGQQGGGGRMRRQMHFGQGQQDQMDGIEPGAMGQGQMDGIEPGAMGQGRMRGMGRGMRQGQMGGMRPGQMGGMGQGQMNGFAQRRQGTMGGGFGMPGGRKLDLTPLGLSEDQKQRIKQIRVSTRERAKDIRKGLVQKQTELRSLIFSPDASDAQIRATRREVRKAQDEMEELNLNDLLAIRGMLTPEQKSRLPQIAPPNRTAGLGRGTKVSQAQRAPR